MSGTGTPEIPAQELTELTESARTLGLRVAVVASRWHTEVMDGLTAGAQRFLNDIGITEYTALQAPGSFELPVLASHAAQTHDAVITLGVVIRGGTPHFDYVCAAATDGLTKVAVESGTPVGFGLLTCDDDQQALDRAGLEGSSEDKGYEAAHAAVAAAVEITRLDA
ncbi:6,7-dimethyl-8-ribityllumazine synthase [Nesterenkonia lacusekhoensis]|uniref:6,7-dimethyl-8-ribityllumazine synthase n=1 Tax=Nesterenkonia lacusekhoensis TaxID=150832 RepID=A0ABS4T1R9_9MICC|nr:6,7-dimethyl-8-ribityllumazine synthase [Nesterenkonia lacusekhoensis]MBP2318394.1 6,7-dimethyl-8-ribityllumazine synthase [Nesterenkonia lacusekhoensis]